MSKIIVDPIFSRNNKDAEVGEYVKVSIQDTGIGMDKDTLERIFEPFYTTKKQGEGTGLGLSMVYNIIQQHKGFLRVYSEPGNGTDFSIFIPIYSGKSDSIEHKSSTELVMGSGSVLIIDDEEIIRTLSSDILESCGYTPICAENGPEALSIFKINPKKFTSVLLDMSMPIMSGDLVYKKLREIRSDIPIVIASGFTPDRIVDNNNRSMFKYYIHKPYNSYELSAILKRAIDKT